MSTIHYAIGIRDLGTNPEVVIDAVRYERIRSSRNAVLAALSMEDVFALVVANYLDLEQELLTISLEYSTHAWLVDYVMFFSVRQRVNRRVMNVLTAARLFVDLLPQRIEQFAKDVPDPKQLAKTMLSAEYDDRFGYRFMEALRNYVQHEGLPVTSMRLGGSRTVENGHLGYSAEIYADRKHFAGSDFKPSILKEMPETVDLKLAIREYMSGLASVQRNLRSVTLGSVEAACAELEKEHAAYEGGSPRKAGLSALMKIDGEITEYVPITLEWGTAWRELVKKNGKIQALDKKFVTSEVHGPDPDRPDTRRAAKSP